MALYQIFISWSYGYGYKTTIYTYSHPEVGRISQVPSFFVLNFHDIFQDSGFRMPLSLYIYIYTYIYIYIYYIIYYLLSIILYI